MKKMIAAFACLLCATAYGQTTCERLLQSVENNNLRLKAERELLDARKAEVRIGNTLSDPSVTYDYLWGRPAEAGNSRELNVIQGFDFPTAYTDRSRYIQAVTRQYVSEYAALRQQVLLEAHQAFIELSFLRSREEVLDAVATNARRLSELYAKKLDAGQATILEKNRIDIELMNAVNGLNSNRIDQQAALSRLQNLNGGATLPIPTGPIPEPLPELPSFEEVMAVYTGGDARLSAMRTAVEAAGRQVQVTKSEALPKFEVGYRREYALGESFNGIKMGMTIPIFESRHTVKRARAEQIVAQTQLQNTLSQTEVTMRQLHAKAALLLDSYHSRRMVMEPKRNAELADKALEAGQITVEDYFMEIASICLLKESQLEIERDYRLAIAELMMASW